MAVTAKILNVAIGSVSMVIGIPKANLASILGNTFPAADAPPAGMLVWLDADQQGEAEDGNDLNTFENNSAFFYDAVEGKAPSWHEDGGADFNNLPLVRYTKADSEFHVADDMQASAGGAHCFVVAKCVAQGGSAAGWVFSGKNQHPIFGWDEDGGDNKVDIYSNAGHHRFPDLIIAVGTVYIWEFIANDAGNYLHAALNGTKAASTIAENIEVGWFPDSYAIASQDDDPYVNAGSWDVAEIILYGNELSAGNRASALSYLNTKYNIY